MAEDDRTRNPFAAFLDMQGEAMREMWGQFAPANAPAVPPPTMNPPIIILSPTSTKPRVLILASLELLPWLKS